MPRAFTAYIREAKLIYFGLESITLKLPSDCELMQNLLANCKAVGNDGNHITFNARYVDSKEELWPIIQIAPSFQ